MTRSVVGVDHPAASGNNSASANIRAAELAARAGTSLPAPVRMPWPGLLAEYLKDSTDTVWPVGAKRKQMHMLFGLIGHAVAAVEGRSLHLTCGLKPTTGADLLSWLSDRLRVSSTVRANLPYFAPPDERTTYLQALRKEFTDALHEGVIEEFINARGSTDPGRPMPSLPFVDGIPADGSLSVRLTAAGAWYGVGEDGHVVFSAGGQEWTFSRPVLAVIQAARCGRLVCTTSS
ncbi:hypothetical protein ABR737_22355 [Streptomyces sp. Edi2]|uniref:hypothetical protein n=1 Tax=Streptomyces sp. Edi2 TaxID=3162528 RepID=UPI0033066E07